MRAAIQNHVDGDQPLLYPGLRETQHPKEELSDVTVSVPGGGGSKVGLLSQYLSRLLLFLFLQARLGESLLLIINHDYLRKASPH